MSESYDLSPLGGQEPGPKPEEAAQQPESPDSPGRYDAPGQAARGTGSGPGPQTGHVGGQAPPQPIPITIQCNTRQRGGGFLTGCLGWVLRTAVTILVLLLIVGGLMEMGGFPGDVVEQEYMQGNPDETIALVEMNGAIDMETAYAFRDKLLKALNDDQVRGVILTVNSPGGAVVPSAMMEHWIRQFRQEQEKPIVAMIEQVGASGAYWAASAAEKIYAQQNAMVGSIGVIYIGMVVQDGLENKLGVDPIVITSTRSPFKDRGSPFRMPTEDEKADIRKDLDAVHGRFVAVISRNRGLSEDAVWTLADGEVFDGEQALDNSLIDAVGFMEDAVGDVATELGLKHPRVVSYQRPPRLSELLMGAAARPEGLDVQVQRAFETLVSTPRIMALWTGQ